MSSEPELFEDFIKSFWLLNPRVGLSLSWDPTRKFEQTEMSEELRGRSTTEDPFPRI
jgi:hypothetical protein